MNTIDLLGFHLYSVFPGKKKMMVLLVLKSETEIKTVPSKTDKSITTLRFHKLEVKSERNVIADHGVVMY